MPEHKVLYISYNGGTELITRSQVIPYLRGLSGEGFSFDLLTFEKKTSPFQTKEYISEIENQIATSNIRWHTLRYHKSPSLLATSYDIFTGIVYSAFLIAKNKYSIVHARQIVPAAICVVLKSFFNIRWVFDMRGLVAEEYVGHGVWREGGVKFRLVKWFEKKALLSADSIVVLTGAHKEVLKKLPFLKGVEKPISVIPCCVDSSRFKPLSEGRKEELLRSLGLSKGFILLYLGSLGTCYFLDKMFEFFKTLKARDSSAQFLFLTNYDADTIMAEAKKSGVEPSSVYVKFAEPSRVHELAALGDAGIYFINPYKKFGSCPIKMGEYLASGIALVINSGIGDGDRLVADNDIGVILKDFKEEDYKTGAERLFELLQEDDIKGRCRKAAEGYMSLELGVRRYREIYAGVISSSARKKLRVLFLVPYPTEGASNRVRVEQFMPYLKTKGIMSKIRPFFNTRFYRIVYLPHRYPEKIFWFLVCTFNRLLDIFRAIRYDIVFIHREAYPLDGAIIESILYKMKKPIIFDFDDAIFFPNTSPQNMYIERFKKPQKVSRIIEMSSHVIAGNSYLKDFASRYNNKITVIPSSVDTEKYRPTPPRADKKEIVIGWIGSNTTKDFLRDLEDVFVQLSGRYKNLVFKFVGADFPRMKVNNVVNKKWSLRDEVSDLQSFDIGIMPLPDNEWAKGKCGFKAILYMACGLPVVASPVGANLEIIENERTGFFASTNEEWIDRLSRLIEDEALRRSMGERGRTRAIERYSLLFTAPLFYDGLKKAAK